MNKLLKDQATSSKPDLIADRIVPLFGNNGWVWLQALYESWAWPMSKKRQDDYPFKQDMTSSEKISIMLRLKKYWIKNVSLFEVNTNSPRPQEEIEQSLKQCKMVASQLENAYLHKDSSTINEIVEPFVKANGWFTQDFFMYILSNPLSFFNFTQIAPDADDSERPFGKHFTLLEFLNAVEKVGQYMHYNSKDRQKKYEYFLTWLQKHAETFANASASLEWEMRDNYSPMGDSTFSNWLLITISQLESAIKQEQNTTSIRDYLAAWMDPHFPNPQLDDFAKLTITRESLEILDDFACEHFNKSVHQMAYWDALRRPALYLLATLYTRGFFNRLAQNLQINGSIETLLLSDLPPHKLTSWEDFRQALQECAFSRAKALQYFKDYTMPDKQADLIKRTDKRLLEVWGDKEKWQRAFAKYASEDWASQVQLEDAIKRIEKSLEADFGRSLHGKSLFQGLLAMGVENHNRVEHLPELSGLNRDDILLKLADLKRVQHNIKPDELARRKVETYDKDYLKLKHSLEDIYYGKSIAPENSASLRSRVGHLLAVYIITCYPEFPEHLPSKENYKPHPTENTNDTLNFSYGGTGLPYEAERQHLPPQLFSLFECLFEPRTVSEIKVYLWKEKAETYGDNEAQNKVSQLKKELKNFTSNWQVSRLKNPTRYKVERKLIEN